MTTSSVADQVKGKTRFVGVMALAALLLSLLLAACGDSATSTSAPAPTAAQGQATTTANAGTSGQAAAPAPISIDIASFKFSPAEISIPAGTTVTWTNKDSAKHNVIADDKSFESPTLEKGQSYSHKFDAPATVGYFCSFHGSAGQGMIGKLTVTAAPAQAAPQAGATTAAQAQVTTAAAVTTAAPAATTAAPATTSVVAAAPSTLAATVAPVAVSGQVIGTANFRDDLQQSDQVIINFDALPTAPSGRVLFGWLVNSTNGTNINAGQLVAGANGAVSRKFADPKAANLLAGYDMFIVTAETIDPTPSAPSSNILYSGQLPGPSLIHIRHLLVSFPATPGKIGLEVGLRNQTQELRRQAESMRDAVAANDLNAVKLNAERIVNLIEGAKGQDYGDLNKDGQVQNAGDGYGLIKNGDQLGYLDGSKDHAALAAKAEGATEDIKLHAGHVGITVDNASGWISSIRDRSLSILKLSEVKATEPLAREILVLANQALNGVDLKGDGQIQPVPGSGGVLTSYQHAQLMGIIPLKSTTPGAAGAGAGAAAPTTTDHAGHGGTPTTAAGYGAAPTTAAPAAAPTTKVTAVGGAGQVIKLNISQFKFGDGAPMTIKVGTKVTWTNLDNAPHTATADNSSWDSGTLQKGQSFSFTFNKVATVKYHCEIHPNMTQTFFVVE